MSVDEILLLPDVQERVNMYNEQTELFRQMLTEKTKIFGNVIVTDLRGAETIYTGNRFYLYSMFPEQNVSVWIVDGRGKVNVAIAIGYSILNRTCKSNIGAICFSYGGGGHHQVGTCQVPTEEADKAIRDIIEKLNNDDKGE